MTETMKAQAIITASYILYLIDALLDKSQRTKLSTIRLKQALQKKTRDAQNKDYVKLSDKAWEMTIEQFKDRQPPIRIAIFDVVEMLTFEVEKPMVEMFGNHILELSSKFALKQTYDGVDKEILLESREVTKALIDNMRKVIYDNLG